jgi:four helix bundle protein
MREGPLELTERFLNFAAGNIALTAKLGRTLAGRYLAGQLLRSASSSGANYQEACGAESRADFVHKMQIVLKELRESGYWLRLMAKASLATERELGPLRKEVDELTRIVARSILTARSRAI